MGKAWGWGAVLLALVCLNACEVLNKAGLTHNFTEADPIAVLDTSRDTLMLEFSPDNRLLAVVHADLAEIHIWDWREKRIIAALPITRGSGMRYATHPVRFSPDGKLFAACLFQPDGSVAAQVWNTEIWQPFMRITDPGHTGGCNAIGFTKDGGTMIRLVSRPPSFEQDTVILYDTDNWQVKGHLHMKSFNAYSLSVGPDNLAAIGGEDIDASERQIRIVDLGTMKEVKRIANSLTERTGYVAWSPDGDHIAASGDEGVEIFDAKSGELIAKDDSHGHKALIRYMPGGNHLVESGFDGGGDVVRIWDGRHQKIQQEIAFRPSALAASRSESYFALGDDKTIQVWQMH
jgi:WD40 repeat protein